MNRLLHPPPFTIDGSDKDLCLDLLTYKTAFLVDLAMAVRGSEMLTFSRAEHNLLFKRLPTGGKQVTIR